VPRAAYGGHTGGHAAAALWASAHELFRLRGAEGITNVEARGRRPYGGSAMIALADDEVYAAHAG
jgi:hypothetical protein